MARPSTAPRDSAPVRLSPEQKLVASLISLMEAGTTPWRRPWETGGGGHHVNLISGRRYRGGNPVLLQFGMHLRGSTLPYWCGFAEAKSRGLVPRRGCQAVHVLRPQVLQPRPPAAEHPSQPQTLDASTDGNDQARAVVLYRPVPLFNAADLQGEALADLIRARRATADADRRPEPERLQAAEAVLKRWPVAVIHGGDHACYAPDADRIHLPDRAAFHSAAAALATWAHEAVHSTGHASRLGRDLSGVMGASGSAGMLYAREELVAELGAVLLGDRLEIGSDTANHAAYLSHWIALLRESPRLLLQVLAEARRAADLICPEPDPAAAEARDRRPRSDRSAAQAASPAPETASGVDPIRQCRALGASITPQPGSGRPDQGERQEQQESEPNERLSRQRRRTAGPGVLRHA